MKLFMLILINNQYLFARIIYGCKYLHIFANETTKFYQNSGII